ncbi:MAG: hypothetical protein AMXMBFR58_07120 [Phycisphaerae bacterium]
MAGWVKVNWWQAGRVRTAFIEESRVLRQDFWPNDKWLLAPVALGILGTMSIIAALLYLETRWEWWSSALKPLSLPCGIIWLASMWRWVFRRAIRYPNPRLETNVVEDGGIVFTLPRCMQCRYVHAVPGALRCPECGAPVRYLWDGRRLFAWSDQAVQ